MRFDVTGKISLDHIYTRPDPRAYFSTLGELDYQIPRLAKPYFARLVQEYRESRRIGLPSILDIGCSYGINAALLRCDLSMDELYERYGAAVGWSHGALLAHDRTLVRSRDQGNERYVGLDASASALAYASAAGFIDEALHADLEAEDPTEEQRQLLAGIDLVISTGCLGYVTDRTISRIARATDGHRPWMAHFVLRMFPFGPVADSLAALGYETERVDGVFRQRRFASPKEQSRVLDTLSTVGVDPRGLEDDGWLYAELFVSRPHDSGVPPT